MFDQGFIQLGIENKLEKVCMKKVFKATIGFICESVWLFFKNENNLSVKRYWKGFWMMTQKRFICEVSEYESDLLVLENAFDVDQGFQANLS